MISSSYKLRFIFPFVKKIWKIFITPLTYLEIRVHGGNGYTSLFNKTSSNLGMLT